MARRPVDHDGRPGRRAFMGNGAERTCDVDLHPGHGEDSPGIKVDPLVHGARRLPEAVVVTVRHIARGCRVR